MIQFLKELYLAEFTSFFRSCSSLWTPGINAGKGVAGVSLFVCINLMGLSAWIEILMGKQFFIPNVSQLQGWIASFVVYCVNYYILVIRGQGIKFELEFNNLKNSERTFLRISCWVMELLSLAFFICSIYAYHRYFHIIFKH
jgi:sterol desaturase/sphingolipid hydroxylase (fatty acid hydroxylase superfamily)